MSDGLSDNERNLLARRRMVDEQLRGRGVTNHSVLDAMTNVPRELFLPPGMESHAFDDRALAVGLGQTISQPYIVGYMTAALCPQPTSRVLEIGTGTGYQTAILARLASQVFSIERVPELHDRARTTLARLGVTNITLLLADGTVGLPEHAPFDRIIVTAGAPRVPTRLIEQLAPDGVLVAPVGGETDQQLVRVVRRGNKIEQETLIGCRFVKLVGTDGWSEASA